ncbi:MAG: lipopolysaccharide heptosyltransferase II [Nitrospirota bacterium]
MPNKLFIKILDSYFRKVVNIDSRRYEHLRTDINRILLINITGIGDTVVSTPAISAVRNAFPHATIVSVVTKEAKAVLLNNPDIDDFIYYPGKINFSSFFFIPTIIKRIRAFSPDLSIVLHGNDPDAPLLSYLSKADTRIGWKGSRLEFLFTDLVNIRLSGLHIIDRRLQNLLPLGIMPNGRHPHIHLTVSEERMSQEILGDANIVIGIHPFANTLRHKLWPVERYIELSNRLYRIYNCRIVIFGGREEKGIVEEISKNIDGDVFCAAGKLGIRETAAIIKRCRCLICIDSGLMHVASAVDTPVVALFGPEDPDNTGPFGDIHIVLKKELECSPCTDKRGQCSHLSCMKMIQVDDVLNSVEKIMEGVEYSKTTDNLLLYKQ